MGDPLSDPRAHGLLTADTGEIGSLAGAFQRVAGQAQTSAAALRGANGDGTWTGKAADAFRTQLGKLPGDLDKVQQSYGEVANGLSAYASGLEPIQSQFRSLASQLTTARSNLSSAQSHLSTAKSSLSTATSAAHATSSTPAVIDADTAVSNASSAVGNLQGAVTGLESRGYHLLDEFDTIRGHARSTVSSAAGIAPSQGWFSSMMHSIGNFMGGVGHFFAGIGEEVWKSAQSLPSDVAHVIEHPTNAHDWAKLGEDAAIVAGAVAVVAAVVVCPADALGLEALADGAGVVEGAAGTAATYAQGEKTMADSTLLVEGKGSVAEVTSDVVGLAMGHIEPGKEAAEADVDHLTAKSGALEQYGESRALGATPRQAYDDLTDDQRSVITQSTRHLANPARLNYMRTTTAERLESAGTHLNHVRVLNDAGHTIADHAKKEIVGMVAPEKEPSGARG
ncbi:MAG TPA: hypothetical protein VHW96_06540 [Solirubrobacteraceae bacterium]|jgi:uncharacterized protein YukE|nr:hypothetical protein [Solirubrobacteraceae bacterium]